ATVAALGAPAAAGTWGDALAGAADGTLVVDVPALDAAGVGPASPLPAGRDPSAGPFWEAAGLTLLRCEGGAVLTARPAGPPRLDPQAVAAIARAARSGFDPSGRFRRAADWAADPTAAAGT